MSWDTIELADVHILYLSVVVSLRAALIRRQRSLLPQAEPGPLSDYLPGVLRLWAAYAV